MEKKQNKTNSQCKTNWMSHNVEKITRLILRMHCQLAQSSVFIQKLIYWYNYWTLEFYVRSSCSWNFIKFRLIACVRLCVLQSACMCLRVPVCACVCLRVLESACACRILPKVNLKLQKLLSDKNNCKTWEWYGMSVFKPIFALIQANRKRLHYHNHIGEKNARLGFYLKIIACEIFK